MGKSEEETEESTSENSNPIEEKQEEQSQEEQNEPAPKQEEKKTDVDKLRKVIKVNDNKQEKPPQEDDELDSSTREGLEQKRAILQSIKDFDFQIKKNQEEITSVNKKLESVGKDLDDLVSLYEIVSEQMNPFVGLSKVTKKRIDALENFTKEIEDLKNRMGDIESFAERAGADIKTIHQKKESIQSDTSMKPDGLKVETETDIENQQTGEEINDKDSEKTEPEQLEKIEEPQVDNNKIVQPETTQQDISYRKEVPVQTPENNSQFTNTALIPQQPQIENNNEIDNLDLIIEKSLGMLSFESKIDNLIDDFLENLKF